MSVTITPVVTGINTKSWDITASADADEVAVITHGFVEKYLQVAPALVFLVPLLSNAYAKEWALGAVTTTVINLSAGTPSGGGSATPQLQVIALLPNSMID